MFASQYATPRSFASSVCPRPEPREPFGCGWFESSYELARGAQVEEDLSLEEFELWMMVAERRAARATTQRGAA